MSPGVPPTTPLIKNAVTFSFCHTGKSSRTTIAILVSNIRFSLGATAKSGDTLPVPRPNRIERSCKPPGDRISRAPAQPGVERFDAFFTGHAYDPHRHDFYAIGYTLSGIQSFVYRGARANSVRGNVIVIH